MGRKQRTIPNNKVRGRRREVGKSREVRVKLWVGTTQGKQCEGFHMGKEES